MISLKQNGSPLAIPAWGLFIIASLYVAKAASLFVIPVLIALIIAMIMTPFHRLLMRAWLPRGLAAFLVVGVLLTALVGTFYALSAPAEKWFERVPEILRNLEPVAEGLRSEVSGVKQTSNSVDEIASIAKPSAKDSITVDVRQPSVLERLVSGTPVAVGLVTATAFLVFFMLAVGDQSLRAFARSWTDPDDQAHVLEMFTEARRAISRYLATIAVINVCLGLLTSLALYWIGLPNVWLWGAMVALFNFAPYLGALLSLSVISVVSFATFGATTDAIWAPSAFLVLTTLEGQLVTPLILGGGLALNPLLIFISIMGLGILWGAPGALMAVPLLVCFAIAAGHVQGLKPAVAILRLNGIQKG